MITLEIEKRKNRKKHNDVWGNTEIKLEKKKEKGSICVPLMWLPQNKHKRRTLILSFDKEVLVEGRSIDTQNVDFEHQCNMSIYTYLDTWITQQINSNITCKHTSHIVGHMNSPTHQLKITCAHINASCAYTCICHGLSLYRTCTSKNAKCIIDRGNAEILNALCTDICTNGKWYNCKSNYAAYTIQIFQRPKKMHWFFRD